jgi:hypothetical protein
MDQKKEWKGILINECRFLGKVVGDPIVQGDFVFFDLKVDWVQRDANGQFVEHDQLVPCMVEPSSYAKNAIETHVKDGRQLWVEAFYKSWEAGGVQHHRFAVVRVKLGDKPYVAQNQGGGAPVPPQ